MNSLKKLTLFFFMSLAIAACSSDDDNGGDNNGDNNNNGGGELFTAKVDGADFAASTDPATLIGGTFTSGVLAAQGSTNDGKFINFQIVNYNGVGTYATGDDVTNANQIQYGELSGTTANSWISNGIVALSGAIGPGTITVTAQDANGAEGTFSFEGYNGDDQTVKNITEGQFVISFD